MLGVLVFLTSLALTTVSAWLVPPYLALMALIVFAPVGNRDGKDAQGQSRLHCWKSIIAKPAGFAWAERGASAFGRVTRQAWSQSTDADPNPIATSTRPGIEIEPAERLPTNPDSDSGFEPGLESESSSATEPRVQDPAWQGTEPEGQAHRRFPRVVRDLDPDRPRKIRPGRISRLRGRTSVSRPWI